MKKSKVKCPYCGSEDVAKFGKTVDGILRYTCKNPDCRVQRFQEKYKNIFDKNNRRKNLKINNSPREEQLIENADMEKPKVKCPYCGSEDVVKFGKNSDGTARYKCKNPDCMWLTFQEKYKTMFDEDKKEVRQKVKREKDKIRQREAYVKNLKENNKITKKDEIEVRIEKMAEMIKESKKEKEICEVLNISRAAYFRDKAILTARCKI